MRILLLRFLSCAAAAALTGCAGAAMEGANMAKDEAVYQRNLEAARAGSAEAQYKVGAALCCSLDDGKRFYDTRASTDWLCRAAAQGYAPASQKLGQIYSGDVVDGVRLMRRVAERVAGRAEAPAVSYAWLRVAEGQGAAGAGADAEALWDDFDADQRSEAERLTSGGERLPCRWDEVFGG